MAEVKWIKLLTEMFDDEKIKLIEAVPEADMILVIWIKLLTLAGKKNMNGYIFLTENIPYTDEMFATLFNRPLNTVRLALETFKKFGMILYNGEGQIKISNWEKHQNIDGLERIRENTRKRVAKFREKHKELPSPTTPPKELDIEKSRVEKSRGITLRNVTPKNNKINFNYETRKWENITDEDFNDWSKINPNCNIISSLEHMRQWLMDDRSREKKYYRKFICNWIKKEKGDKSNNKAMTEEEIMKIIGGKNES